MREDRIKARETGRGSSETKTCIKSGQNRKTWRKRFCQTKKKVVVRNNCDNKEKDQIRLDIGVKLGYTQVNMQSCESVNLYGDTKR